MRLSISSNSSVLLHSADTVGNMVAIELEVLEEIAIIAPDWIYDIKIYRNGASECRKRKKG